MKLATITNKIKIKRYNIPYYVLIGVEEEHLRQYNKPICYEEIEVRSNAFFRFGDVEIAAGYPDIGGWSAYVGMVLLKWDKNGNGTRL